MTNDKNDDEFLNRIRVEPSKRFLSRLKANLDQQANTSRKARVVGFRVGVLAALIAGTAVAFVAWKGFPEPVKTADRSAQSKILISSPSGGGSPKANVVTPLPGAGMLPAAPARPEQSRTIFTLAGPTALVLNAQNVARRPVEIGMLKAQPLFTVASTAQAIAMLCHAPGGAGTGSEFADLAGANRRITPAELEACSRSGVLHVAELRSGYESVVLARSNLYAMPNLSARGIFLALAAEVPDPKRPWVLIKNRYTVWSQIDPALPEDKIEIFGPPLTSATAAAFQQTLMEAGCRSFLPALQQADAARYEKVCRTVREDGVYRQAGADLQGNLEAYPNAMALLDFRSLGSMPVIAASVDGVVPGLDTIVSGQYTGSRAMYLYVNVARARAVPGASDFIGWYVRSILDSPPVTTLVAPPEGVQRSAELRDAAALQDLKF